MPTKVKVDRVQGSGTDVTLHISLPENDPRAAGMLNGIGKFLAEWLTPEEAKEFQRQIAACQKKVRGTSPKPVGTSAGRQMVQSKKGRLK